jgi:excisionase family DNA binding protein
MSLKRPYINNNQACIEKELIAVDNGNGDEMYRWLNSKEAARYLSISEGTLRNLTSNGRVPFYKLGRSNRYCRYELDELIMKEARGVRGGNQVQQ